jgi:inosose dehydratase
MINRRNLLTSAIATAATLAVAPAAISAEKSIAKPRLRKIGHTGITWGYSADDAPNAIRDVGELGYRGFESFGGVLEAWEAKGGLQQLLENQQLPLVSAYCPMNLTDPAKRSEEILKAVRWGALIANYGGHVAVIGPDNVDRKAFDFGAHRADIITALNNIGQVMTDAGIKAALHPHTGSCIQTRDEIWDVMESTNARDVMLCPDTGELLAAGVDPLTTIRHFGDKVAHVHIKDYKGGKQHDGYVPVGKGRLDLPPIVDALEDLPAGFMVMAELNPDPEENKADPTAARRAAEQSKAAFEALGYKFRG